MSFFFFMSVFILTYIRRQPATSILLSPDQRLIHPEKHDGQQVFHRVDRILYQ
jgi:hypothetical protein